MVLKRANRPYPRVNPLKPSIVLRGPSGFPVSIEFSWSSDRWRHELTLNGVESPRPLLRSVEGQDQSDWPDSPPLQELNQHSVDDREAILGVGMAGKSHWSASINRELRGGELNLELACLARSYDAAAAVGQRPFVGSTYHVHEAASIEMNQAGGAALTLDGFVLKVEPARGDGWQSRMSFRPQFRHLVIEPIQSESTVSPSLRWGYRFGPGIRPD